MNSTDTCARLAASFASISSSSESSSLSRRKSGTIVSETEANNATEAALIGYPGGIVDRVVQLSTGEYEVHYIGVNWPHHVFVSKDFKVVGAN